MMRKLKKVAAFAMATTMFASSLIGCGSSSTDTSATTNSITTEANDTTKKDAATKGAEEIYFLNFKPESADVYNEIVTRYEAESGVKVKVVTAASGTYETTLKSEIAKTDAPTIFQINGPVGYQTWKDYCADLSKTDLYNNLTDKGLAVSEGEGVYGIPYAVEGYGIIYNDEIMQKYFALEDKAVSILSTEEIKNFATLKSVVEDMTKHVKDLGIDGVFANTSLAEGNQWRWQTHLANLPLYYEFSENKDYDTTTAAGLAADEIQFKYEENYKNIFDLYINNSTVAPTLLGAKTVDDSMAEFALGKCAMVQNGNWAWGQISGLEGNVVKEDSIKYLPIYTGVAGEENQGLCIGTENYFAINNEVSPEKQQASIDFLNWLFSSDTGKAFVSNDLKFIAPFTTFSDAQRPTDPLAKQIFAWMENGSITVNWTFAAFPSEEFKNYFGSALLEYAQGNATWDDVVSVVKESWASERAAAK
ncbi:carbohydrate ABC transporter substrate-binding protein (CUT1 family) [Lachnotalea glycerini]|uniref:Carbohydrate ABC transporter substrate-binding protein (CUT1 family) n=2 Tax=Lachnotalea glycerini TaxID=1763509 RepID=A0A318EI62_9FIRM|nr:ABC transporter substrate-binding protein [Lachnotalea glycerini]PXV86641.1 carbohydrate ABC transporter substrate-binding protein (CUT1 family) [Lachnotalea glycerini]